MREGSLEPQTVADAAGEEGSRPRARHWGWLAPLVVVALALCINLTGNDRTGLWDRDEPRFAQSVREMRARGDWIFPTFNGEPRYHKPILIYWLMGLSTAIAGDSPFGARLVSALAGAGTCLLVWGLGKGILGPRGGFLAGLMLAVSPIMVAESKLATTDATLTFLMVGALICLLDLANRSSRRSAALFWACLSLAFLTKGPIGPLFLLVSVLLGWLWGWPASLVWRRLHVRLGLLAFLVSTLPWYAAIAIASRGAFLRFAFTTQVLQRVTVGMEDHGGFPGYYLAVSVLAFFPWSVLIPAAAWGAIVERRRTRPELRLLLAWIIGPWLLLESLPTRMIHYYLPAFPACALLVAWLIESVEDADVTLRRWRFGRLGLNLLGGIGITGAIGFLAGALAIPGPVRLPLSILALVMGAGTMLAMLWLHRGATRKAILGLSAAWGIFLLVMAGWLIPAAEPYRTSRKVGERLAGLIARTGVEPALLNYKEPGVIYALGRPVAAPRDRSEFDQLLNEKKRLLTVVTPEERAEYGEKLGLKLTPLESLDGFSLTKGKKPTLEMVIIERTAPVRRAVESTAQSGTLEQPLVK